jgi:hypothetical protein
LHADLQSTLKVESRFFCWHIVKVANEKSLRDVQLKTAINCPKMVTCHLKNEHKNPVPNRKYPLGELSNNH